MKNKVTVLVCSNALGSHKLELAVVGESKNPICLKNVNKSAFPVHYLNQRNAWMDSNLFSKWYFDIFVPAVKSCQVKEHLNRVLLLFDSCPSHPEDNSKIWKHPVFGFCPRIQRLCCNLWIRATLSL